MRYSCMLLIYVSLYKLYSRLKLVSGYMVRRAFMWLHDDTIKLYKNTCSRYLVLSSFLGGTLGWVETTIRMVTRASYNERVIARSSIKHLGSNEHWHNQLNIASCSFASSCTNRSAYTCVININGAGVRSKVTNADEKLRNFQQSKFQLSDIGF